MSEIDRNQQARAKDAAQRATFQHKQEFDRFLGDLQLGRIALIDRFGAIVKVGDNVLWRPPATHDLVWTITDAVPVLDPQKPVGVLRVKMECTVPAEYFAGVPSMSMIRVGVNKDAPQDGGTSTGPTPVDGAVVDPAPNTGDPPPEGLKDGTGD